MTLPCICANPEIYTAEPPTAIIFQPLAGKHGRARDLIRLEVVVDLYDVSAHARVNTGGHILTLAVYPGSVALNAPGILTTGEGVLAPVAPVTLTWAQLM